MKSKWTCTDVPDIPHETSNKIRQNGTKKGVEKKIKNKRKAGLRYQDIQRKYFYFFMNVE